MATRLTVKTNITDAIIKLVMENLPVTLDGGNGDITINDLTQYKRIVSGGVTSVGEAVNQQLLLFYQEDFQSTISGDVSYNEILDIVINCKCKGTIDNNVCWNDSVNPRVEIDYQELDPGNLIWIPGGGGTSPGGSPIPAIRFNISDYNSGSSCAVGDLGLTTTLLDILTQMLQLGSDVNIIDPVLAQQVLNTTIYELYPSITTRQEEIDKFFADYERLKGTKPNFTEDWNDDTISDHFSNEEFEDIYTDSHDISTDNPQGYIPRLAEDTVDTVNAEQTLQQLRDDLDEYLRDIDTELLTETIDERPEYENKSPGYLKIRHLNQAIIVRKEEGTDVGLMDTVFNDICPEGGPSYLCDGFTITMWVRFLDKVNSGTLFNFGNPFRSEDPMGFTLETFIIHKDDEFESGVSWEDGIQSWAFGNGTYNCTDGEPGAPAGVDCGAILNENFFQDSDYERFIRLVIYDPEADGLYTNNLRDSHVGKPWMNKREAIPTFGTLGDDEFESESVSHQIGLLTHIRVPIDFNEWFFIVASYDPSVAEDTSQHKEASPVSDILPPHTLNFNPYFWTGNIDYDASIYTHKSGYGNRCKVEIISKSDLIRARGFKLES